VDIAAYLGNVQFTAAVKQGSAVDAKSIFALGGGRPPGILHHVARTSQDRDMVAWLLSIGYRVDEEDEVISPLSRKDLRILISTTTNATVSITV